MAATFETVKDPDATLDYVFNWTTYLGGADTISSVAWTVGAGLTNVATSNTTTTATIRISGGTAGQDYEVACRVTLASGQIDERTLKIQVRDL